MIERGSGVAVWRQIENTLAEEIAGGRLQAGERLPTELQLAERFGVNRHTIRRAVSTLVERGLLRVEQGRGTFVQDNAIDYAIS
ncbi:GntR family transcriptional regulator, partial [uncultured Aquitalea sp.]